MEKQEIFLKWRNYQQKVHLFMGKCIIPIQIYWPKQKPNASMIALVNSHAQQRTVHLLYSVNLSDFFASGWGRNASTQYNIHMFTFCCCANSIFCTRSDCLTCQFRFPCGEKKATNIIWCGLWKQKNQMLKKKRSRVRFFCEPNPNRWFCDKCCIFLHRKHKVQCYLQRGQEPMLKEFKNTSNKNTCINTLTHKHTIHPHYSRGFIENVQNERPKRYICSLDESGITKHIQKEKHYTYTEKNSTCAIAVRIINPRPNKTSTRIIATHLRN